MQFLSVFRRSTLIGLALALIALILIDVTAFRSSMEYTKSVEVVKRAHRILAALNETSSDLVSAESEVRGFAITEDDRYLSMFESASARMEADLSELKKLITDPQSTGYLQRIEELSNARLKRLEITLDALRTGGIPAVQQVAGPGKDLMDEIRMTSTLIKERQLQLLAEREQRANALSQQSVLIILMGSSLAVVLLAVSMILLGQQLVRRERLEREVLEISEREQRLIGQDLHDGVCQQLTGISLLSRSLSQKLSPPQAAEASQLTRLINESIEQVRQVTRGLHPVPDEPAGLMQALRDLAERAGLSKEPVCRFVCPQPVPVPDQVVATNLYRIAQEAVQNAMRHATPHDVEIRLTSHEQSLELAVADDGCGIPAKPTSGGIGLEIMAYRAQSVGASLEIRRRPGGGTEVACKLPLHSLR